MKYREFGKTGVKVSALGFGCMRLPLLDGSENEVDEAASISLIREAIDKGINYIDTAYPYHGGKSEIITGRALKNGYREKVYLATKLPCWHVKKRGDMDRLLDEQLEKLQTSRIDFYLVHSLNKTYWENVTRLGIFDFLEKAKAAGKIGHIGFSFHDELPLFKEIVDAYPWEFCQIQYNFMDTDYQAGQEGLEYAAAKGMGIVIMEPLRGGSLIRNIPQDIEKLWQSSTSVKTPVDTALRFTWDHPAVGTVLSGMNTREQLDENIAAAERGEPGNLTKEERVLLKEIQKRYKERIVADCTNCRYCMPCPFGVDIPANLLFLNNTAIYADLEPFKHSYINFFDNKKKADQCTQCGQCEEACPQHIEIIDCLQKLTEVMA